MSRHKRDSTSLFDGNFLSNREYEEIYIDINNAKSCYYSSQSHLLGAARCTDGMSSQGTTKAINKYNILIEKIKRLMNMVAEMAEEIKENKQNRKVVSKKNDEIMQSK
uniref:Uncharacterized protein n=1 Tax=Strongyloides venezuelensis TaxID=75913 RepID=A0A0K0FQX1_STRVS